MNFKNLISAAALGGLLSLGTLAQAAPVLYGADGSGSNPATMLYTVDPTTGAATAVGAIGFAVTGLAWDATAGIMYGSTSNSGGAPGSRSLITINLATGAGTLVGSFGTPGETMADLAINSSGTLFGWLEPGSDDLYTINKATGAATLVGDAGLGTAVAGLAFDSSNTLYLESVGTLMTLNAATGALVSTVGSTGGAIGMGMAFDSNDILYALERLGSGASGGRNLVTVDTATGLHTVIGATTDGMDALAWVNDAVVPAPATLLLLVGGLAAIGATRRRRINA